MTYKEKLKQIYPHCVGDDYMGGCCRCPHDYPELMADPPTGCLATDKTCTRCWNREIPTTDEPHIKDSGNRTEFQSGAVRDIQEGKGRCDLMPLDVVAECYNREFPDDCDGKIFAELYLFMQTGDVDHLMEVLGQPKPHARWSDMLLEVAIHFEEGAKKYGDRNWEKGIPVRCYINSAIRHYLKWLRGDKDEPHDRAFCWNILCAIWTCKHHPHLNEYAVTKNENTCVCCGAVIPEGRQVCPSCEEVPGQLDLFERKEDQ